ncbi:MAG: HRDC domain-containing protein [Anaerolineaceae bacterium]|nr:HRDC domain-containing protein [Anaerolineaceae bacterium]
MKSDVIQPAILIETNHQLLDMISKIREQAFIGVDTESNSLYEYQEKICLIQFSTIDQDYLVDTIKLKNLSPLNEIFSTDDIEKIFHAAEYDLMCLKRDFHFEFNNIFDTMIASRILGFKSIGLQSLLKDYFDVNVEKKYQRANWGKRPLSNDMLRYAQSDTHYLINLRKILLEKLKQEDKWELATEDFKRITCVDAFVNNKNNDHYWKIIKGNSLSPQQENVLIEIYFLRENLARQLNRPPFKVFGNQTIVDLAKKMPNNEILLNNISGLSPKLIQKYGEQILKAITSGLNQVPSNRKERIRPNPLFLQKYDALKNWRRLKGIELSVESDIVLPKEHMEQIAHIKNCALSDIQEIMQNIPYRFQQFGKEIFAIIEGIDQI